MANRPDTSHRSDLPGETSEWPYTTLVLFGFFGTDTRAGKRLAWRANGFLALFVACMLMGGARDGYSAPFPDLLWLLGVPLSAVGMWWAYGQYLRSLDELSRTIQLKAFAFGYGAALTLMATGLAIAWITPTPLVPWELLGLPVFAEGFRGLALAHLARQYR